VAATQPDSARVWHDRAGGEITGFNMKTMRSTCRAAWCKHHRSFDRHHLWQRRNQTVSEYGMTVQEVRSTGLNACQKLVVNS
jgi:hypothetical protein